MTDKTAALARLTALEYEAAALRKIIEAPEEVRGVWKPKTGQKYWCMVDDVSYSFWDGDSLDMGRFQRGNCFPTKEAAEAEEQNRKIHQRLREMANWKPDYNKALDIRHFALFDHKADCVAFARAQSFFSGPKIVWFPSEWECREAFTVIAEEFGEGAVKSYLTWE